MIRLFFISLFIVSCGSTIEINKDCIQRRAAFDIGSESTKIKVADVDRCENKILRVLLDDSIKVPYRTELAESKINVLSEEIQDQGIKALRDLQAKALETNTRVIKFYGVGTSALRQAANGEDFINHIRETLGIEVKIISQEQEAKLGFFGVKSYFKNADFVWDIGGGSQQIVYSDGKDLKIVKSPLAAVSFREQVIRDVQKSEKKTPNPISKSEVEPSKKIVKKHFRSRVKDLVGSRDVVIGIGGVHYYSIRGQTGAEKIFSQADIRKTLARQLGKSDKELKSKYASTEVTNLILVLSQMELMGIDRVIPLNINMADGLLVENDIF